MKYLTLLYFLLAAPLVAQDSFYVGADLSYVNEMEECGVIYRENDAPKDPYAIFADAGANLVRLRLWHTPEWYDELNEGRRYGDLADVRRSIARAKAQGMDVLLDFHLSDFWADPGRQIMPAAWEPVADDLPALQDSLYNYVYGTLTSLAAAGLLPEMVQIGNETNKGIMQTEAADSAGWALDWGRNAALFNTGIRAVREAATVAGGDIKIALHIAGPENAGWLLDGFTEHGVTDYDVIGLSYYWAWHQPTTIGRTGAIIAGLRRDYAGKDVMIFETGYIWTTESNDDADNIISEVQDGYAPASPDAQRRWLIDLTQEVYDRGGAGVLYWEPAWVSSRCRTPWGRGSHQEHAAFFDFDSNLLDGGGAEFLGYDYAGSTSRRPYPIHLLPFRVYVRPDARVLTLVAEGGELQGRLRLRLTDVNGRTLLREKMTATGEEFRREVTLPALPRGVYFVTLRAGGGVGGTRKIILN